MLDNPQTFANRIYGEIITLEKYKFSDARLIAEVVRDTVAEIARIRADVVAAADRRKDRVAGPAFERLAYHGIQEMANKAADDVTL